VKIYIPILFQLFVFTYLTSCRAEVRLPALFSDKMVIQQHGKFLPAEAVISDSTVLVFNKKVTHPQAVRYGWDIDPEPNLVNNEGLPAVPFRTNLNR
jgi:hypothetical protein